ncbi:serine/threonine-protein kinase [Micromonospora deserti]|nr:protein kinase [Micromonospora deserti]
MVHREQTAARRGAAPGPGLDLGVAGCSDAVEIGRGGFGVVYRAWQPDFSRWVAVKVLAADWHGPSRARFERELRVLGRLSDHPHIVTLHQAGRTASGNPYLLMAYEEGGSLADRLAAGGAEGPARRWAAAVAGGIAVAGALETAHRAGVLHRDVKPENILISGYGEPKLADFGLARPRAAEPGASRRRVTASVLHAAPEVLRGEPASVASDVYALASTVLHWIHGAPAFAPDAAARGTAGGDAATRDAATRDAAGDAAPEKAPDDPAAPNTAERAGTDDTTRAGTDDTTRLLRRIAADPVPDLRPAGVPDAVCAVLERAMAKDPARRHPTAVAFAEDLQRAQQAADQPVTPFVLGGGDAGGTAGRWPDSTPADRPPPPRFSLTARRRAALGHGLTATAPRATGQRRPPLARSLGALVMVVSVLATAASAARPAPDPVEVPELAFGDQEVNAESTEQAVTVRNVSAREVRLTGVTVAGPHGDDLRIVTEECTARRLAPGQRCEVRLTFTPRAPGPRRPELALAVAGRAAPVTARALGTGQPRRASRDDAPPGRCYDDAYQVGPSAYGHAGGLRAISVKQYWSPTCRATMAYVWVWKQYRDNVAVDGGTWAVDLAVGPAPGTAGPPGRRQRAEGQPFELWTEPSPLTAGCTAATATVTGPRTGEPTSATTEPYCGR